jgi:hypothetical protein
VELYQRRVNGKKNNYGGRINNDDANIRYICMAKVFVCGYAEVGYE